MFYRQGHSGACYPLLTARIQCKDARAKLLKPWIQVANDIATGSTWHGPKAFRTTLVPAKRRRFQISIPVLENKLDGQKKLEEMSLFGMLTPFHSHVLRRECLPRALKRCCGTSAALLYTF